MQKYILTIIFMFMLAMFVSQCGGANPPGLADDDAGDNPDTGDVDTTLNLAGWDIIWHDEFEGNVLNSSKWDVQIGDGSAYGVSQWGNNELQNYTGRADNITVEGGTLTLHALKETFTGPERTTDYTSGRIRTINKGDWTFGRFEIRAKLPFGQGIWPAIWMLPTDNSYGGWASSGEIDIVELVGNEANIVHGTLHYGATWPNNAFTGGAYTLPSGIFNDQFHVFRLEWESGVIRWYVDDQLYQTQTQWSTTAAPFPAPFDQRFHMILNVAVGGNWPGNPDDTTVFPQVMEVDYVRVYRRSE